MGPWKPVRFGAYWLERRLAVGGMYDVYLGRRDGADPGAAPLVIKRVLPHIAEDRAVLRMLLDDARRVAPVRHPNLVAIDEVGEVEDGAFICLEFVDGLDLGQLLRWAWRSKMRLAPELAVAIVSAACAGLHAAHRARLVHGDLRPTDLRVTPLGAVKVLGLGLAAAERALLARSVIGIIGGKIQYLSPELARGEPLDARTDVFHLGLILFEALTAARAFVRETEFATLRAVLEKPAPLPSTVVPGLSPALDEIVSTALQPDPERRFTTAERMQQALDAFLGPTAASQRATQLAALVAEATARSGN